MIHCPVYFHAFYSRPSNPGTQEQMPPESNPKDCRDTSEFHLHAYDYELPEGLIAQHPREERDRSRLLVLGRRDDSLDQTTFDTLPDRLPARSLIVVNNSWVTPGRLRSAEMEMLLLTPLKLITGTPSRDGLHMVSPVDVLLRPAKKARLGRVFHFEAIQAAVLEKGEFGQTRVELRWPIESSLEELLGKFGEIPIPPYIRRTPEPGDVERYQTIYADAREFGSMAAPTAGLHFTATLRDRLVQAGHEWVETTLYVGYGTFSPIRCEDIRDHRMHGEYVKLTRRTMDEVLRAKAEGRAIIAVGTTSMRTLEGIAALRGRLETFEGWLDTYISPGFDFQVVDGLITNFHLPKSSLLVLVSAFAGRERILAAYRRAVAENFRFFSYGDAMYIRP